jgi:hypothetical protein
MFLETETCLWAMGISSWIGAYGHYPKQILLNQSGITLKNANIMAHCYILLGIL